MEILHGLLIGLVYGLMALGVALIFGVMKTVNFAHGELYMIGGYALYYVARIFGITPVLALPLAVIISFFVGLAVELFLLRPMFIRKIERLDEYVMIATFGVGILLRNSALAIYGHHFKRPPDFIAGIVSVGILSMNATRLMASAIGALILCVVLIFIKKTWVGRALQATAQNRDGAAILGINTTQMNTLAFAIASALAGAAGAILAPLFLVYPNMGEMPSLKAFVIVVLGGMGSIKGSIIGSLLLGVVESLCSTFILSAYRDVYSFLVLLAVLLLHPTGLFGEKERRV